MATVLNRTTFELRKSVNTPDFPVAEWVINPDLTAVLALPVRYWKIQPDDTVVARTAAERAVADTKALPGIITGLILSIGRAAGETAPILFTAAFYSLTDPFPNSLLDPILVLPYQLFVMATEVPNVAPATKWATAFVLLAIVLGMNLVAAILRARLRRSRRW